jgi:hypothetical protein
MFNLEAKIAEWQRQMLAAGIKSPMPLDELESHLREDFRAFLAAGKSEDQAFELAVSRLGSPGPLRTEFNKLQKNAPCWPVTIGSWVFTGLMILFAVIVLGRLFAGKLNPILGVHILVITVGYGAAFLAGAFGMFYVSYRLFHALTPHRQQSLDRAVLLFSQVSASMVIVGTVLGMLWCQQHIGRFLMGDVKEVGALCVVIWFVSLSVARRYKWLRERATMLMCIVGNVIVSLAWFGAGIYEAGPSMHVGRQNHWLLALAIFAGIHLIFLVIGVAPAPDKAES